MFIVSGAFTGVARVSNLVGIIVVLVPILEVRTVVLRIDDAIAVVIAVTHVASAIRVGIPLRRIEPARTVVEPNRASVIVTIVRSGRHNAVGSGRRGKQLLSNHVLDALLPLGPPRALSSRDVPRGAAKAAEPLPGRPSGHRAAGGWFRWAAAPLGHAAPMRINHARTEQRRGPRAAVLLVPYGVAVRGILFLLRNVRAWIAWIADAVTVAVCLFGIRLLRGIV
jgi:hypothetical protein